ncbi:MAG: AtzE family amidohydrolase [Cyanobacteria bacterium SBLK]|nr:AtzE family amidohydrolase [Cyanobacteria bacterium SBLK]
MTPDLKTADAISLAQAVRGKTITAEKVIEEALREIDRGDRDLNCFTDLLAERAIADARDIDREIVEGRNTGLLAGVPFAVKNLYDIAGVVTLAGSKINADRPPALEDAMAIARLKQAGMVLMGALNMDEYAYGFTTENSHYGITRNPHDRDRVAGGSSGGSAAAVAGGFVPLALGSDTNGSVRVPAAFCGIYGFISTYGRVSRSGMALLAGSLDRVGVFARSIRDIAATFDFLQGEDRRDPVCTRHPPEPSLSQINLGIGDLRIAVADGYFAEGGEPEVFAAVAEVAKFLQVRGRVTIPEAHRARAAAYTITASEGANLHLPELRSRPEDFDPATRDRFLAGALIPSHWYIQAQRFRRWYRDRVRDIFRHVDIILAPTTPCVAPHIGRKTMTIAGEEILVRPNMGRFTQPLSFIGLPILSVPIHLANTLPLGVQIIAAPFNESLVLRVAATLERQGEIAAKIGDNF